MARQKFDIVCDNRVDESILTIVCDTFGINKAWVLGILTENLKVGLDGNVFAVATGFAFNGACVKAAFHSGTDGIGELSIAVMEEEKIIPNTCKKIAAKVEVVRA